MRIGRQVMNPWAILGAQNHMTCCDSEFSQQFAFGTSHSVLHVNFQSFSAHFATTQDSLFKRNQKQAPAGTTAADHLDPNFLNHIAFVERPLHA